MRNLMMMVLTVVLGAVLVPITSQPASASCVGPQVVGKPIVLHLEPQQSVRGRYFASDCYDTVSCPVDGGPCTGPGHAPPRKHVKLRLRQGDRTWVLDVADAGRHYRIRWTFVLPPGVKPGHARLKAPGARGVPIAVAP